MPGLADTRLKALVLGLSVLLGWIIPGPVAAQSRRDILLDIVSNCVEPKAANYCSLCRAPRSDSACAATPECRSSTEVWAMSERYTAIRDIKMCGCPAGFVHGLALPRQPVRGVEDPARPEGIWQFAWDTAVTRIEAESIALVVNPRRQRSQDQLHVHLLRLRKDARARLTEHVAGYVRQLDQVWTSAARAAAAKGLDDYGVLVMQRPQEDFMVVITADSPEAPFTEWRCDP